MTLLLKDALRPNLVQTLEGGPAFVHAGPFGNIAHGCNSLVATKTALALADVVVTEAGFGSDLGAEKFFDIKCRLGGLQPEAAVVVATVRALKLNGGARKQDLGHEDMAALMCGLPNLEKHIANVQQFGVPVVVALNRFTSDTDRELSAVTHCGAGGGRDRRHDRGMGTRRGRRRGVGARCARATPHIAIAVRTALRDKLAYSSEDRHDRTLRLWRRRRRLLHFSRAHDRLSRIDRPGGDTGVYGQDAIFVDG